MGQGPGSARERYQDKARQCNEAEGRDRPGKHPMGVADTRGQLLGPDGHTAQGGFVESGKSARPDRQPRQDTHQHDG